MEHNHHIVKFEKKGYNEITHDNQHKLRQMLLQGLEYYGPEWIPHNFLPWFYYYPI